MALWNNVDNEASKPKYLSDTLVNTQTVSDKDATIGVDCSEAAVAGNKAKGIVTPGWTQYRTYTDQHGNTRNKAEILVAFGGDFTTGDNDTIDPDAVITIGTQPQAASVFTTDPATFTVVATATRGATLSYQWQVSDDAGSTWAPVAGATAASLVVEDGDDEYVTANQFRVVVSAVGAVSVTSNAVALTITDATITIDTQPANETVAGGAQAEFTVVASIDGSADLSYQWEVSTDTGANWTEVADATDANLVVVSTDAEYVDANQFRVVVSGTKGATPVTSDAATLTVTA